MVEKSLSIRSRKLLKRPRLAMASKAKSEEPILYVERPEPVIYCKTLYAPCDSSSDESSEEEPEKIREIRSSKIGGSGYDLANGILAVDGVRFLSNRVR